MPDDTRILVVEDDPTMQRLLASHLEARGYNVVLAEDGWGALRAVEQHMIDVVLLDHSLPNGLDGVEVCRRIREMSGVPIMLVTVCNQPDVKVAAFEAGADDYLTKPYHAGELLARVAALLRRTRPPAEQCVMRVGPLTVDTALRQAWRDREPLHLTRKEFDLLATLVRHAGRTLTYAQILEAVWGPDRRDVNVVHTHMSHLRRKLEIDGPDEDLPVSVPGVGYRFASGV